MLDSGVLDDQVDLSYACDAPEVVVHTTKRSGLGQRGVTPLAKYDPPQEL